MAQTIQIKRSSATATPSSLSAGELAYSDNSDKLFIGQPSNNTVVSVGGKYYTDLVDSLNGGDGITFDSSTGTISANIDGTNSVAANTSTNTASRTYKIQKNSSDQLVVNVPWSDTNTVYTLPLASTSIRGGVKLFSDTDVAESDVNSVTTTNSRNYGVQLTNTNKMVVNVPWTDTNETLAQTLVLGSTTGGTSINVSASDNINFSTTSKAIFGGTSSTTDRLEIGYTVSGSTKTATIKETGSGRLKIIGQNLDLTADNSDDGIIIDTISGTNNLQTKIVSESDTVVTVSPSGFQLGSGSTVTTILDQDDMISDSATALATQQSIKKYVDDSVPTSVANATNATNASNAVVTEDTTSTSSHYIGFYDDFSGTKAFKADRTLAWIPDTETLNIGTGGTFLGGDCKLNGVLKGPTTFYIDPSPVDTGDVGSQNTGGTTDDTGEVIILGNLRVTGTTTTLDSQTVTTGDSIIRLNADLPHSTSAADGGFHVYRGQTGGENSPSRTNAKLIWDEEESSFRVDQATGTLTTLLTAANWGSTYTGVVDGGNF
jgi:hypothetical protein